MKSRLLFIITAFFFSLPISSSEITAGDYTLDLLENNGTFRFFVNTADGVVDLVSGTDPGTSGFFIYENDNFYSLGSSFRYRETYVEKDSGGVFSWNSKNLSIVQEYSINAIGELKVDLSISNKTEAPVRTGLKFLLDAAFEHEDRFAVYRKGEPQVVDSEWEALEGQMSEYWTSGILGENRKALKVSDFSPAPDRLIFGNWDRLVDADYYYNTVVGRNFSNPPYSINDSAVLHLYSPVDILPGNSISFSFLLKGINAVDNISALIDDAPEEAIATAALVQEEHVVVESETQQDKSEEIEEIAEAEEEVEKVQKEPIEEPVEELEPETETQDNTLEMLTQMLETTGRISDIISLLSNPGMITDSNIKRLEELIDDLEELKLNEDTQ